MRLHNLAIERNVPLMEIAEPETVDPTMHRQFANDNSDAATVRMRIVQRF